MEFSWQDQVDVLLNERRPDRYTPGVDDEWLDDVAREVASLIPEKDARAIAARLRVGRREGELIKILGVLAWVAGLLLLLVDPLVGIGVLVVALLLTVRNISIIREKRHQELLDAQRGK